MKWKVRKTINKKYFRWLLKSHRTAFLFTVLIYIVLLFGPYMSRIDAEYGQSTNRFILSVSIGSVLSIILAVVYTLVLFSWIHRKQGVDLYFSLPVTRKEELVSTCLLAWLISWGSFLTGTLAVWIAQGLSLISFPLFLAMQAWSAFGTAVVILCTACVYSFANNVFDGVVMVLAYAAVPLAVQVLLIEFCGTLVAGGTVSTAVYQTAGWLSPLYMAAANLLALIPGNGSFSFGYLAAMTAFGFAACIGLQKQFIKRKSERAEQISDDFLAYPFIIAVYALICLSIFSMSAVSNHLNGSMVIWYVVLFVIYMIASFVCRRSFHIPWKPVAFYAAGIVITLLIAEAGWHTRGFGMADNYDLEDGSQLNYSYYAQVARNDLGKYSDGRHMSEEDAYVSFILEIPYSRREECKEVQSLLETYRKKQIDAFYSGSSDSAYGELEVVSLKGEDGTFDYEYMYPADGGLLSEADLETINAYTYVTVQDYSDGNEYTLDEFLARIDR